MSQEGRDALFIPSDFRANFKEVIAKRSDLARFDSGRMIPAGSGLTVTYVAGLVVGIVTASGLLKAYASASVDGSQVPVGVLKDDVFTDEFGNGSECVVIKQATLLQDLLVGMDSGAITALGGKASVEHGTNLLTIYA